MLYLGKVIEAAGPDVATVDFRWTADRPAFEPLLDLV